MKIAVPVVLLCMGLSAVAQDPTQSHQSSTPQGQTHRVQARQPSLANYSILLVSPVQGDGAVVVMHNPKNDLEFVPVGNAKQALNEGYVAARVAELGELIVGLKEENARLAAENAHLRGLAPQKSSSLLMRLQFPRR